MKKGFYGIDYKSEIKKYKKLCRSRNSECRNYLEWRDGILSLIDNFDVKTLENFRRFCLYQEEIEKHGKDVFLALEIAFITLYFSVNVDNITFGIVAAVVYFIISYFYLDDNCSADFYRDVAEIADEKIKLLPEKEQLLIKITGDNSKKQLSSNSK